MATVSGSVCPGGGRIGCRAMAHGGYSRDLQQTLAHKTDNGLLVWQVDQVCGNGQKTIGNAHLDHKTLSMELDRLRKIPP